MNMQQGKVSIVLCTYNGERYLHKQLDSLLQQTYPIFEIIIQDDHSQDGTFTILEEYAHDHDNIKLFQNESAHGVNGNFFSAMRKATGDFIAISDQDDIWEADKIEKQIDAIGNKLLCGGHSRPFSEDGAFVHFEERHPNTNLIRLLFITSIPGHTMLMRRELLEIIPFDDTTSLPSSYDFYFEMTAAAYNSIAYVDGVLVNQRRHVEAVSYIDYSHNLRSWQNGLYILRWSVRHYKEIKPYMRHCMSTIKLLLDSLDSKEPILKEAKKIVNTELEDGLGAYLRLTMLFVKHHSRLFQTSGGSFTKQCRALLYPIMQMYNYRYFLKAK